jgi:hypothetical protein
MQIYIKDGIRQIDPLGCIGIDEDTKTYIHPVIWDSNIDGIPEDFDESKLGGYQRIDNKLVYSQEAFDANEAIKAAQQAEITTSITSQQKVVSVKQLDENFALRALAKTLIVELNDIRRWLRDFKASAGQATSLANLKERINAMPAIPGVDVDKLRDAMKQEATK